MLRTDKQTAILFFYILFFRFQRQQTCPTCRMDVLRASGSATAGAGQPAAAAAQQHGPQQHPQVGQQPAQMIFQQQMAALRNNLEALQRQRQQG